MSLSERRRARESTARQDLQVGRRGRGRVPGRLRRLRRGPRPSQPAERGSAALESPPPPVLKAGTVAPAFSLPALDGGGAVSLSAFRGTAGSRQFLRLLVSATAGRSWAPWPAWPASPGGRVAVVGVDSNESSDAAATRLLAAADATYPVARRRACDGGDAVPRQRLAGQLLHRCLGPGRGCGPGTADRLLVGPLAESPGAARMSGPDRSRRRVPAPPIRPTTFRAPSVPPVDRAAALAEGRSAASRPSSSSGCWGWSWS